MFVSSIGALNVANRQPYFHCLRETIQKRSRWRTPEIALQRQLPRPPKLALYPLPALAARCTHYERPRNQASAGEQPSLPQQGGAPQRHHRRHASHFALHLCSAQ